MEKQRKLKVYGLNYDGRSRRIVAATSQKEAAALMGVAVSYLRKWGCETGNKQEVTLALANPRSVWECSLRDSSKENRFTLMGGEASKERVPISKDSEKHTDQSTVDGLSDYPPCWVFDFNRRVYPVNENGKSFGSAPIWREHWVKVKIVGETKLSWLTVTGRKIPKKGGSGICFSERELNEAVWVNENRRRLSEAVRSLEDFATLKAVDEILNR